MYKQLLSYLKLQYKRILSRFNTPLPVGRTEADAFMNDIIELSGEYADKTSMQFAIASIAIHAPSDKAALPKKYFVDRMRKSAANQVFSQVFQDIKTAQEQRQKTVEDTTPSVVSDVKPS